MKNITRNRLSTSQTIALADFVRAQKWDGKTIESVAAEAGKALGFDVSPASVGKMARDLGISWSRKTAEEYKKKPQSSAGKLRTIARIQLRIIDELGIELKHSQRAALERACEYSAEV